MALATACTGPDAGGDTGTAEATQDVVAAPATAAGTILRVDPRFDGLVPPEAVVEKIADGFVFIEGPVWIAEEERLLFSDIRANAILQ
jgi:gluconolactonase